MQRYMSSGLYSSDSGRMGAAAAVISWEVPFVGLVGDAPFVGFMGLAPLAAAVPLRIGVSFPLPAGVADTSRVEGAALMAATIPLGVSVGCE